MSNAAVSSELRLRIASALVLVLIAGGVTVLGDTAFDALWLLAAFVCFHEWAMITLERAGIAELGPALLALLLIVAQPLIGWSALLAGLALALGAATLFAPPALRVWPPLGLLYCAALLLAMIALRHSPPYGMIVIFWLFAIVWASDIAAFFTGRALGGPKLMPRISPKKTWSGFVGGTLAGAALGSLALAVFGVAVHWQHVMIALCLSIASAIGDLGESALKRHFGVKDSGRLIPGHGGLLDRLDGFVAAAICALVIGYARNGDPATGLLAW